VKYLLDTTVISDFVRGHPAVCMRLLQSSPGDLATSVVTVMEIEYGLARDAARAQRIRPIADALLGQLTVLPYAELDARETGRIRGALARAGRPIGPFDALLAGTAKIHRLTVVTSNCEEFRRVPGLSVEDWRAQQVHDRPGE
jgi:tRNA(fMet)-specific endonuclease VapC